MTSEGDRRSYYQAALRCLMFVESRRKTDRRFGRDADALWAAFRGDLETIDRLELLLRDADTEWKGAFGARSVFGFPGVAEDEPFGSSWESMPAVQADEVWRKELASDAPDTTDKAIHAVADAWGLTLAQIDVETVRPTDRLVVAGPSAIAAAIQAFQDGDGLDWAEQVTVIATPPAHRHLAACGAALLNQASPTKLFSSDQVEEDRQSVRVLVSEDADPSDRAQAERSITAN